MSKEWYESKEWNDVSPDYIMPKEDVISSNYEISAPESEYTLPTEYYDWDTSKTEYTKENEKDKLHKKKMRKMLYGITSMVMVASLGLTISNNESIGILSKQKVRFSIYNRYTDYAKNGVIAVGGGNSLWGVGHVSSEFRHVDYNGNAIPIENKKRYGYDAKWVNSNGEVLTVSDGGKVYAVFDKDGSLVHEWNDADFSDVYVNEAAISDNNRVFFQGEVSTDQGDIIRNLYYTTSGKELCRIDCDMRGGRGTVCYGTPFRDGIALCNDSTGILLIHENGKTERLVEWKAVNEERKIQDRFQVAKDGRIEDSDGRYILSNVPCIISGNVSQGYFLVIDAVGNMALVNMDTGEMYKTKWAYADIDVDSMRSTRYVRYSDNEGNMIHLGTLMCKVEENEDEEVKYYLFDVTKHCDEEGNRTGYLACYDAIYFEDYQYLLVRDGTEYCYIDLNGNKVSENYKKASTFNDFGYALIQTQSGAFYVIDSEFNKLERISTIDDFIIKDLGEVFCITYEENTYSYYYGPDIHEN